MDTLPPLISHPRLRALAPDPPAVVRVQNLATTLRHVGRDAWNRPHKQQPCLLSAEVAFAAPFGSASATDSLGEDTVHYGTLSKAMLAHAAKWDERYAELEGGLPLAMLPRVLWEDLAGGFSFDLPCSWEEGRKGDVDPSKVRFLSLTAALPKASLLGEGVKVTASVVFETAGDEVRLEARAMALEITRLRVPTLIGVNENERKAKQFVVVTVTVEGFTWQKDVYTEIEADVVKAMEESSFETLEALGAHLANVVLSSKWRQDDWQVCIRMEKPTAIAMADCPIVEVRQG